MRLLLADLHTEAGASMLRINGFELPAHYGDPDAERSALSNGCGLVDRSWISRLELRGADRGRFLNGLVTSNVLELTAGSNRYGFFTDLRGRVLADVYVLALDDRLWLELPPGRAAAIQKHLQAYIVADRVEVLPLEDVLPLTLVGPESSPLLERLGAGGCAIDANCRTTLFGSELHLARRELFGVDSSTIWISASMAPDIWKRLVSAEGGPAPQPVGFEAVEALRVEQGIGRWGQDYGADNLPQETGLLEAAVDFEKGCYLGQEIVARVHYLGKPKRLCARLLIAEGVRPKEKSRLFLGDAEVGILTSVVESPRSSRWSGLSILKSQAAEVGQELRLEDGRQVEVCAARAG